ncbi:unnamed protein product [Nezara viridula]|uniref:Uncharacterized protein n=1 Tax=Nezara viridula TaxID=85310 RepID=A0A9P0GWE9_NEZVI|nr:unnamed protein product [Nezara viridula]
MCRKPRFADCTNSYLTGGVILGCDTRARVNTKLTNVAVTSGWRPVDVDVDVDVAKSLIATVVEPSTFSNILHACQSTAGWLTSSPPLT